MNAQASPAGDIEIVTATADTAAPQMEALVELLRDAVASGGSIGHVAVPDTATATAYWEEVLAGVAAGRIVLLLALAGGRAVGTVQLHPAGKPNQPHRADVAKLLVHSSHRRRGLGEGLMRAVEAAARDRGLTLLTLDTLQGDSGERLYARLGWTAAGVVPDYAIGTDGVLHPTVIFYRRIGAD